MNRGVVSVALGVFLSIAPARVSAQALSGKIGELIRFGSCEQSLCLVTGIGSHGSHYLGAAQVASADLLTFLTNAITASVGRLPISSTSGGTTFSFVGGAPVRTTTSAGPIFAERGTTLGKGRTLAGVNTTHIGFSKLRGVSTDDLQINLSHEDANDNGLGDPAFENDVIAMNLNVGLTLQVTTLFATYGLTDKLDVSVALPFVMASLDGAGNGRIFNPTGTASGVHYFGTASDPSLTATSAVDGSASGIGDIALRAKLGLKQGDNSEWAVLGDLRLPTGDETQFHGSGAASGSALLIGSTKRGNFSPHVNAGFAVRTGDGQNNAMLATVGFDHMLTRAATVAVDVLSEFQMGGESGRLPQTIALPSGAISGTNIPDQKDNPMSLSLGGRFLIGKFTGLVNGLIPIKSGGLQSKFAFTLGIERTF